MKLSQTNEKFDSGCSPLKQNYKKVQPESTHQNRKNEGEKISTSYFTSTLLIMRWDTSPTWNETTYNSKGFSENGRSRSTLKQQT